MSTLKPTTRRELINHEYCKDAIKIQDDLRSGFLNLGEMLFNIREMKMYEPAWESWGEYCMEFKDFSIGSISKLISVYDIFVRKLGFTKEELIKVGGWTKLYAITSFVKNKEDADKWLSEAETHSRKDLEKSLVEAKTHVSMDDCEHKNTYTIRVCKDCGDRERLY